MSTDTAGTMVPMPRPRRANKAPIATTRRANDKKQAIIAAAATLFEDRGYHNTGMEDIAEAVGLRKSTLYYYVRSKDEILVWVHNDVMNQVLPRLERYVTEAFEPDIALKHVIVDILHIMDRQPGYLRVFFEHHRELPNDLRIEATRSRDRYQWLVESLIQQGIRQEMFRPVPVRLVTLTLFGMTNWSYQWYRSGGELGPDEVAEHILDVFLRGIESRD